MTVENAAKYLNPSEGFKKYKLNENSLKSQSQLLGEFLHEKAPISTPEDEDLFKTVIIKQNPMDKHDNTENLDTTENLQIQDNIETKEHIDIAENKEIVENLDFTDDFDTKPILEPDIIEEIDGQTSEGKFDFNESASEYEDILMETTDDAADGRDSIPLPVEEFDDSDYHDIINIYDLIEIKPDSHIAQFKLSDRNLNGFVILNFSTQRKLII